MDKHRRQGIWSRLDGVSTSFSPKIGDRFAGRYELKSPLRGDGAVRAFLAFDHHEGLEVTLVLFDPACAHPNAWSAFARIVADASSAKIPGLVLPRGVGKAPPVPPFCLSEPQALRGFDRLRELGPMQWERAVTLGERAAAILHASHVATGVAHRSLTPSRCAVTIRDEVKVLDFGVAELELGRPDGAGYRAPEQRQGVGDARSDVYTLAVLLFELISGQESAHKTPRPLRKLVAAPRPVEDFLAKAMAPDPAQRPANLAAMRAGLRELLGSSAEPATVGSGSRLSQSLAPSPSSTVSITSVPPGASAASPAVPAKLSAPQVTPSLAGSAAKIMELEKPSPSTLTAKPEVVALRPTPMMVLSPRRRPASEPELRMPIETGLLEQVSEGRTEVLNLPGSPTALAPDRTEVHGPVSHTVPAVVDKTEKLPLLSPPRPRTPEHNELVRQDDASLREVEKTSPRNLLRGPLAALESPRSMPGEGPVAHLGTLVGGSNEPPTEKIVRPLPATDTTLLLPSGPAPPVGVRPSPVEPAHPESAQSVAAVRQPVSVDPDEATTIFRPERALVSARAAGDPLKKALIWINVVCFSIVLLALLWVLLV